MKVNILGSCYSRELFNYTNNHEVGCYVLQQSLFTMFAKPLPITLENARSVDGTNFTRRMMFYEFNKLGLEKILKEDADFLIVDFADCRYDIYEFDNPKGVKIIYTHESRATFEHLATLPDYQDIEKHYFNVVEGHSDSELEEIVDKLVSKLLTKFKPENIILNKMNMAKSYFEKNEEKTFENNFHLSREPFIHKIENIFLNKLKGCKILTTTHPPLVNINHRFGGPHPMHFEDIFYQHKMNLLNALMNNDTETQKVDDDYELELKNNIESIKQKEHLSSADCKSAKRVD